MASLGRGQVAHCKAGHDMRGVERSMVQISDCIEVIYVTGNFDSYAVLQLHKQSSSHYSAFHSTEPPGSLVCVMGAGSCRG